MCLIVDKKATERLKNRMKKNGGWLYLYKVVVLDSYDPDDNEVFVGSPFCNYSWSGGWNKPLEDTVQRTTNILDFNLKTQIIKDKEGL